MGHGWTFVAGLLYRVVLDNNRLLLFDSRVTVTRTFMHALVDCHGLILYPSERFQVSLTHGYLVLGAQELDSLAIGVVKLRSPWWRITPRVERYGASRVAALAA